jgi:FKBP-type peptidyl-prolyl cis-trans isomerase FklB
MVRSASRLLMAVLPLFLAVPAVAQDAAPLESVEQRFSYIVGLQLAQRMKEQGMQDQMDVDAFAQALRDVFSDTQPRLTTEEMQATMQEMQAAQAERQSALGAQARTEGEAFLAENKSKDGVATTASGLQYRVLEEGTGEKPSATDTVKVDYEGRLLNGTVFDSSIERGEPATFGVNQVIPGWQEALQMMPVGAKWEVWIPADLAYGAQGAGADIGPNETLHFMIELLEIDSN